MGEHSPLPWFADSSFCINYRKDDRSSWPIPHYSGYISEAYYGSDATAESKANAAYIVQACNAFPELLKVLKDISPLAVLLPQELADQVVAALAKAGAA